MTERPDLLVYSPRDEIQAVVEVKTKRAASDSWASRLRRNLVAHSILPRAKFFLLVLPDHLWLWRDTETPEDLPADYKVPTREVLGPYLEQWPHDLPSESTFELVVKSWLSDLAHAQLSRDTAPAGLAWVFDSGFYDTIKAGHVERKAVA